MKTLHTVSDPKQYPAFWTEEWLQSAINEVDKRAMSPEELLEYEMTLSANALALKHEERKIEEAEEWVITKTVQKLLRQGKLSIQEIAESCDISLEHVNTIQKQMEE